MRTCALVVLAALLALGTLAPAAAAKVWFPMRDHVLVVGKHVRVAVPGCESRPGCISGYPGPVRVYLVRAGVDIGRAGMETTAPPSPSRALGRLGDHGRLRFAPKASGLYRLVALATVGTGHDLRTVRLPISPVFPVHPRGWEPSG